MVRSQRISASGVINANPVRIGSIVLTAGSGAAASAIILNSPTASTNTSYYSCEVNAATATTSVINFYSGGLELDNGGYLTLSGSGAVAYIYYI